MSRYGVIHEIYTWLSCNETNVYDSEKELGGYVNHLLDYLKPLRRTPQAISMNEYAREGIGPQHEEVILIVHNSLTYKMPHWLPGKVYRLRQDELPRVIREHGEDIEVRPAIQKYWKALVRLCKEWQIPRAGRSYCRDGLVIHVSNTEPYIFIGTEERAFVGDALGTASPREVARLPPDVVEIVERCAGKVLYEVEKIKQENEQLLEETYEVFRPLRIKGMI